MALVINGVNIPTASAVYFNGISIKDVVFNNVNVWHYYDEELVYSISCGGWAFASGEQTQEYNSIVSALTSLGLLSSSTFNVSGLDSMARFIMTGNYVIKLDGVNIGADGGFAIDHAQDWIGIASNPNLCGTGAFDTCSSYYSTWGRYNKTLSVYRILS